MKKLTHQNPLKQPNTRYPVTTALLMLCVALTALTNALPFLLDHLALAPGQPWGLLTYQFIHVNWRHVLSNFTFGLPAMVFLEHQYGGKRLITWYVACGIGSAALHLLVMGPGFGLVGASGAIFGLVMMACLNIGRNPLERLLGIALLSFIMVPQLILAADQGFLAQVAYWGHIGGGLTGILLCIEHLRLR